MWRVDFLVSSRVKHKGDREEAISFLGKNRMLFYCRPIEPTSIFVINEERRKLRFPGPGTTKKT